jgi:hypothetical protein
VPRLRDSQLTDARSVKGTSTTTSASSVLCFHQVLLTTTDKADIDL